MTQQELVSTQCRRRNKSLVIKEEYIKQLAKDFNEVADVDKIERQKKQEQQKYYYIPGYILDWRRNYQGRYERSYQSKRNQCRKKEKKSKYNKNNEVKKWKKKSTNGQENNNKKKVEEATFWWKKKDDSAAFSFPVANNIKKDENLFGIKQNRLPVNVISEYNRMFCFLLLFLGSGKATWLELNIGRLLIQQTDIMGGKKNLRKNSLTAIKNLALDKKHDYLIMKSTRISQPMQVVDKAFTFRELKQKDTQNKISFKTLSNIARLDTMVINSSSNFNQYSKSLESLAPKFGKQRYVLVIMTSLILRTCSNTHILFMYGCVAIHPENGQRNGSNLLTNQIEFANVFLLNKIDLLDSGKQCEKIKGLCGAINAKAKIIEITYCEIGLPQILNTNLFDFANAQAYPGWLKQLRGQEIPESGEYGIKRFMYRECKPFNPLQLHLYLAARISSGVYRAKGFLWIATKNGILFEWNQAGDLVEFENTGNWFASMDESKWGINNKELKKRIKKDYVGEYADGRQEIVFIGKNIKISNKPYVGKDMNEKETKNTFRAGFEKWEELENPFVGKMIVIVIVMMMMMIMGM